MKLSKIFLSYLVLLLGILFVIISLVSYQTLERTEMEHYRQSLKKAALLLSQQPDAALRVKEYARMLDARITLVAPDGRVIAESSETAQMENLARRPEVAEAMERGWGSAVRRSHALGRELLYVAKRLDDGSVLRLSVDIATVRQNFLAWWFKLVGLFLLFLVAGLAISYLLSRRIDREMGQIVEFVRGLGAKRYGYIEAGFSQEFETIAQQLSRLAKRLAKRDEKKRKFTRKLQALTRQQSELLSAIGHEFKNPVAVIRGYTQTLLEDPAIDEALRQRFLAKIDTAAERIDKMVDTLALAVRFESGESEPKRERFKLCEAAKVAAQMLESRHKGRVVRIECDGCEVEADRTMIELVLINLIDNALKYSDTDVEVRVQGCRVCVRDSGVGIEAEQIEKITQKFYRATPKSWENSMGLGLYIADYILRLHGATLEIRSEVGKGSEFCFALTSTPPE